MVEPPISEAKLLLLEAGQVVVRLKRWKAGWEVLKDGVVVMNQGRAAAESAMWWNGTSSHDLSKAPVVPVCKGNTGIPAVTGHYLDRLSNWGWQREFKGKTRCIRTIV